HHPGRLQRAPPRPGPGPPPARPGRHPRRPRHLRTLPRSHRMTRPSADLVVLAYSGGLDTTVTVHRLVHEQGRAVVALLADVGQGEDLQALAGQALAAGATDAVVVGGPAAFATEFLVPAVRANALYEGRYPLVSALSRPLIARLLVEEARRRGAGAVANGC